MTFLRSTEKFGPVLQIDRARLRKEIEMDNRKRKLSLKLPGRLDRFQRHQLRLCTSSHAALRFQHQMMKVIIAGWHRKARASA